MIVFKPSKPEKTVVTIRIDSGLLKNIDAMSGQIEISRNEFILQCIAFALEHYPKMQKET